MHKFVVIVAALMMCLATTILIFSVDTAMRCAELVKRFTMSMLLNPKAYGKKSQGAENTYKPKYHYL